MAQWLTRRFWWPRRGGWDGDGGGRAWPERPEWPYPPHLWSRWSSWFPQRLRNRRSRCGTWSEIWKIQDVMSVLTTTAAAAAAANPVDLIRLPFEVSARNPRVHDDGHVVGIHTTPQHRKDVTVLQTGHLCSFIEEDRLLRCRGVFYPFWNKQTNKPNRWRCYFPVLSHGVGQEATGYHLWRFWWGPDPRGSYPDAGRDPRSISRMFLPAGRSSKWSWNGAPPVAWNARQDRSSRDLERFPISNVWQKNIYIMLDFDWLLMDGVGLNPYRGNDGRGWRFNDAVADGRRFGVAFNQAGCGVETLLLSIGNGIQWAMHHQIMWRRSDDYLDVVDEVESGHLIGRDFFVVEQRAVAGRFDDRIRLVGAVEGRQRVAMATRSHDAAMLFQSQFPVEKTNRIPAHLASFHASHYGLHKSSYLANEWCQQSLAMALTTRFQRRQLHIESINQPISMSNIGIVPVSLSPVWRHPTSGNGSRINRTGMLDGDGYWPWGRRKRPASAVASGNCRWWRRRRWRRFQLPLRGPCCWRGTRWHCCNMQGRRMQSCFK